MKVQEGMLMETQVLKQEAKGMELDSLESQELKELLVLGEHLVLAL